MLDRFIKPEELEGKMYKCEKCSNGGSLQDAKKQLLIADPPDVSNTQSNIYGDFSLHMVCSIFCSWYMYFIKINERSVTKK